MLRCDRCSKALPTDSITLQTDANHFRALVGTPKADKSPTVSLCSECAAGLVESHKAARESLRPACDKCGSVLPVSASTTGAGATRLQAVGGVLPGWGVAEIQICAPCAADTVRAYSPPKTVSVPRTDTEISRPPAPPLAAL